MGKTWSPPRTADELPDDDDEAVEVLAGGYTDGNEIARRERKLWPERNCPPWMKKDPEATKRFRDAVVNWDKELKDVMGEEGIKSVPTPLEDVAEDEVVGMLLALARDKRRPAVQLGAITRLAEMKGMLKNKDRGPVDADKLEEMLEDLANGKGRNAPD